MVLTLAISEPSQVKPLGLLKSIHVWSSRDKRDISGLLDTRLISLVLLGVLCALLEDSALKTSKLITAREIGHPLGQQTGQYLALVHALLRWSLNRPLTSEIEKVRHYMILS